MDKIELMEKLHIEKAHSAFLKELLEALYGSGCDKLTMYEAKKWRERHLTTKCCVLCPQSRQGGKCGIDEDLERVDKQLAEKIRKLDPFVI